MTRALRVPGRAHQRIDALRPRLEAHGQPEAVGEQRAQHEADVARGGRAHQAAARSAPPRRTARCPAIRDRRRSARRGAESGRACRRPRRSACRSVWFLRRERSGRLEIEDAQPLLGRARLHRGHLERIRAPRRRHGNLPAMRDDGRALAESKAPPITAIRKRRMRASAIRRDERREPAGDQDHASTTPATDTPTPAPRPAAPLQVPVAHAAAEHGVKEPRVGQRQPPAPRA